MPRVRMDLAYHGAGFAGWAAQPGQRTVQGELEAALERVLGRPGASDRRRAHRRRRARLGPGGELRGRPRPARRTRPGAQRPHRRRPRRPGGRAGAATASTHAATPARAPTATGCSRSRVPNPFERGRLAVLASPGRARGAGAPAPTPLRGSHDFTAFTPTQTEHVRFERDVLRCEWREKPAVLGDGTRARALDRGRRLHAQHGPGAGRDDAGGGGRPADEWRTSSRCSTGPRVSGPETPRRPTGSTWRRSRTEPVSASCRRNVEPVRLP